jgi:hypothetical protein
MVRLIPALAVAVAVAIPAGAQQSQSPGCLHGSGEASAERERRGAAIRVARMINSAEVNGRTPFRPLYALNVPTPEGWQARLVTDGTTYAFSVKDTTDPCGFTLFSDDSGLIYQGAALR